MCFFTIYIFPRSWRYQTKYRTYRSRARKFDDLKQDKSNLRLEQSFRENDEIQNSNDAKVAQRRPHINRVTTLTTKSDAIA